MNAIKGIWKNGHIELEEPAHWPEGCKLLVEPVPDEEIFGVREEDWPTDPVGITTLLARMDEIEPLDITPEEEADLAAWRQKLKEYELANMHKSIDGLFE